MAVYPKVSVRQQVVRIEPQPNGTTGPVETWWLILECGHRQQWRANGYPPFESECGSCVRQVIDILTLREASV